MVGDGYQLLGTSFFSFRRQLVAKAPAVIVADFETKGIEARPKYPPKPVSLALKWPDQRDYKLMAWGHGDGSRAAGNNCTEKEARASLKCAYESKYALYLM